MREVKEGLTPSLAWGGGWSTEGGFWGGKRGLDHRETAAFRHPSLSCIHVSHQLTPQYEMSPIGTPHALPTPLLPAVSGEAELHQRDPWPVPSCSQVSPANGRWRQGVGGRRREGLESERPGFLCVGLQAGIACPPTDGHSPL